MNQGDFWYFVNVTQPSIELARLAARLERLEAVVRGFPCPCQNGQPVDGCPRCEALEGET